MPSHTFKVSNNSVLLGSWTLRTEVGEDGEPTFQLDADPIADEAVGVPAPDVVADVPQPAAPQPVPTSPPIDRRQGFYQIPLG